MSVDGYIAGPNGEMDWMVWDWDEKLKEYVKEITEHANIFFGDTVELETEECREFLNLEHIPTLIISDTVTQTVTEDEC